MPGCEWQWRRSDDAGVKATSTRRRQHRAASVPPASTTIVDHDRRLPVARTAARRCRQHPPPPDLLAPAIHLVARLDSHTALLLHNLSNRAQCSWQCDLLVSVTNDKRLSPQCFILEIQPPRYIFLGCYLFCSLSNHFVQNFKIIAKFCLSFANRRANYKLPGTRYQVGLYKIFTNR